MSVSWGYRLRHVPTGKAGGGDCAGDDHVTAAFHSSFDARAFGDDNRPLGNDRSSHLAFDEYRAADGDVAHQTLARKYPQGAGRHVDLRRQVIRHWQAGARRIAGGPRGRDNGSLDL